LTIFTTYPDQVVGTEETVTIPLTVRSGVQAQVVNLEARETPEGWNASFRGGGRTIHSVYAEPGVDAAVDLRLEPPADVAAGAYTFVAAATGAGEESEIPITLTVQEKLPPRMSMTVELPTLRGRPSTTFRYNVSLQNEGSDDLAVNLTSLAPAGWTVTFMLNGQEVTDVPLAANETKRLSVEARPRSDIEAGVYPIEIYAQGSGVEATAALNAEVTGEATLVVTAPDGRLSGQAYAGDETTMTIIVQNSGSAPAQGIEMSASQPSDWTVEFEPSQIAELPPGQPVEVTAKVRPSDKAVAGDYMTTFTARTADGASESAEFRITVLTSTLWGIAGVALIAVAVGVVGLAVMRFGRR
jgi:uncharacterized membrane protein